MGFWDQAGNVLGTFAKGTGQVLTGNWGGAWETAKGNPYKSPAPSTPYSGGSGGKTGSTNPGGGMSAYEKEMADLQRQYNSLMAQANQPAPPEIVRNFKYDTNAGLKKAKQMAEAALNPIYKANMDNFLNRQAKLLGQKKTNIQTGREDLSTVYNRLIEDNTTTRDRNTEDTASNINEINTARGVAAREEGLDFDAASRALNEGLGASGTAESGLGRQQMDDAAAKMTRQSNEEVRQSQNQVAAAQTLLNRSFEDLTRSDTRGKQDLDTGNKKLTIDLNQFIETQQLDKKDFTHEQNKDRASTIAKSTSNYQSMLVSKWIQSLSDKGATPSEILLASQTYGR